MIKVYREHTGFDATDYGHPEGHSYEIHKGYLHIFDEAERTVAVYTPANWTRMVVERDDQDPE